MNTTDLISNITLALLPFLSLLAAYIFKIISKKLPENQLRALHQLSTYAVHMVEQIYSNAPGTQKKELATQTLMQLFSDFNLPVPSAQAIHSAIESALLLMNNLPQIAQTKDQANPLERPNPPDYSNLPEHP
jgi:LL-H family phage holin